MQSKNESKGENADLIEHMNQQMMSDAISDPKYTSVQAVEVKMQKEDIVTNTLKEEKGVANQIDQVLTNEAKNDLQNYLEQPEEKINNNQIKLVIHKQQ